EDGIRDFHVTGVQTCALPILLGYPGRTFRHRPYQYLEYQQHFLLPYTAGLYAYQNQVMEEAGKEDKATEIQLATRIKRNANVMRSEERRVGKECRCREVPRHE